MLGTVYNVQPQPPDPANTRWFEAGVLTIGVEYRDVDPGALAETYGTDSPEWAEIEQHSPDGGFSDTGVSIHVCGTDGGHEYLRFDLFDEDPHYHYVWPSGDHNHVVPYDQVAHGDLFDFAFGCLRGRLGPMLAEAKGSELVDRLDETTWLAALERAETLARQVRAAHTEEN